MKNTAFALGFVALFVALIAFADRSDVWSAASVHDPQVLLRGPPDGGCIVSVQAAYSLIDGGSPRTENLNQSVEIAGGNRTNCLNILDAGVVLFKSDKGL